MSKLYIAMETQNPNTKKYYPVVCPVSVECEDVITALERWAGSNRIIASMACATKKHAFEICEAWRRDHQDQGNIDDLLIRG